MIEANPAFKVLIYLASPYSDKNPDIISLRVEAVQDATARLIEAGHLVFSPIVHSHQIADKVSFEAVHSESTDFAPGKTWRDYDLSFIDKADELWILRLPGHTRSKGVHAELYHALDQGKRVRYINYPDLTEYAAVEAVTVNAQGFPDVWEDEFKKEDYGKVNTFGKAFPDGPVDQPDGFGGEDFPAEDLCFCGLEYTCGKHDGEGKVNPKQTRTIIGLTGHAQSGKDTAGKYLVENHGFTRIGLADAVKECLYALESLDVYDPETSGYIRLRSYVNCDGWEAAKQIPHVRKLLQQMGTEVGRNIISETIWLDIAKRKIDALGPDAKVVITDVRFPNEAEWVRSLGGEVVRINRPGFGPVNEHSSDKKLEDKYIDVELQNDDRLEYLYRQIDAHVLPYAAAA